LQQKIAAIAALSVTITASVLETNKTWPLVTIDSFQERSASARSLSGALTLSLVPIVADETRADYERFSRQNTHWLDEAMEYQTKNGIGQIEGETSAAAPIIFPEITTYDGSTVTLDVEPGVRE